MKKYTITICLLLILTGIFSSCKKEDTVGNVQLLSYTFEPASNPGLSNRVEGTIQGNDVFIRVPNSIDINQAIPSFTVNSEKFVAFVGNTVQESGISRINLADTTTYRFSSPGGMSFYTVYALKNASFLSFGFYREDNPDYLFKDYKATIKGLQITVDLPVDADISKLKARYTTSQGATVTVGGLAQTSGKNEQNYEQDVVFELKDEQSQAPDQFTVKVGRLTAPVWSEMNLGDVIGAARASEVKLMVSQFNNLPYLVYTLTDSNTPENRKAVVATYDSTKWVNVGPSTGISDNRIDGASIDIDRNGVVYVAYKDYDGTNAQLGSVKKYENGQWSFVGNKQFTGHRVSSYFFVALDSVNTPFLGYTLGAAAAPLANRATYISKYANGAWSGQTLSLSATGFYAKMVRGKDNHLYYVTMDLTGGTATRKPTVYKFRNGNWTVVGTPYIGPAGANSGGINIDLDIDKNGEIYVAYQVNSPSYASYVMHWNGTSWKQFGDGIAQTTSSTATRDNIAVAVHPNGTVFFAYSDNNNGLVVRTFNEDTNNWNAPTQLTSKNGDKLEMKISADGIPYLSTIIDGGVKVYRYDIPKS
ncbi:hypothetical protein ACFU8T_05240 [Sphingobacterium spiritivorum]|uniref:hypothetical protein n=1 Tax=Sphingobacterium spiritivorum TaxID=258 RepID=UPI0036C8EDF7